MPFGGGPQIFGKEPGKIQQAAKTPGAGKKLVVQNQGVWPGIGESCQRDAYEQDQWQEFLQVPGPIRMVFERLATCRHYRILPKDAVRPLLAYGPVSLCGCHCGNMPTIHNS